MILRCDILYLVREVKGIEMTTIIYKTKDCSKEIIVHDVENVSYNSASKVLTIGSRTGWGYLDIADIEYFNIY